MATQWKQQQHLIFWACPSHTFNFSSHAQLNILTHIDITVKKPAERSLSLNFPSPTIDFSVKHPMTFKNTLRSWRQFSLTAQLVLPVITSIRLKSKIGPSLITQSHWSKTHTPFPSYLLAVCKKNMWCDDQARQTNIYDGHIYDYFARSHTPDNRQLWRNKLYTMNENKGIWKK